MICCIGVMQNGGGFHIASARGRKPRVNCDDHLRNVGQSYIRQQWL